MGTVKAMFKVNIDGSITDIELVQKLGHGCDQEAIRLITNGPAWIPANRNGTPVISKGEIEIYFSPE